MSLERKTEFVLNDCKYDLLARDELFQCLNKSNERQKIKIKYEECGS